MRAGADRKMRFARTPFQTTERGLIVARMGQSGGAVNADFDFNARAEAVEDGHEAVDGEARKVGVAYAGEVGSGDSGAAMGGAD